MQAEKTDNETEKNDTKIEQNDAQAEKSDAEVETKAETNDASKKSAEEAVTNKAANLKIEDESGSSAPSSPSATQPASFLASFKAFSKFGDPKSDGKLITLSQSDKWMKQAKVIDGKKITTTDTGIYFKKHKYENTDDGNNNNSSIIYLSKHFFRLKVRFLRKNLPFLFYIFYVFSICIIYLLFRNISLPVCVR